jgi:hypothetical protein
LGTSIDISEDQKIFITGGFRNKAAFGSDTFQCFGGYWDDYFILELEDTSKYLNSINYIPPDLNISIFPNPSHAYLHFYSINNSPKKFNITLFDLMGRLILQKKDVTFPYNLETSKLEKGSYLILISSEGVNLQTNLILLE